MSDKNPAFHNVRLVSCASRSGHRDVTLEVAGGHPIRLQFRIEGALDIARHVLLAQHALHSVGAEGKARPGGLNSL